MAWAQGSDRTVTYFAVIILRKERVVGVGQRIDEAGPSQSSDGHLCKLQNIFWGRRGRTRNTAETGNERHQTVTDSMDRNSRQAPCLVRPIKLLLARKG